VAQSPTIFRSYRIYLRDARNAIGQSCDIDLTSDDEAHDRALMMLGGQATWSPESSRARSRVICRSSSRRAIRS